MFKNFIKLFIKNSEDTGDAKVRSQYGKLTGITGIILNFILCIAKITAGIITGAISIVSDGINNLSDAGSSVITMLGFKLSEKKPDKDHPFGHGRMEYFAGLAVSAIIIVVAFELLTESITKITTGATTSFSSKGVLVATLIILSLSILVKVWLAFFNLYVGKKINSVAMHATALDSITDSVSTLVVLICTIISFFVDNLPIDGFAGVAVSIFIGFTGIKSIKEVVDLLLGEAPDEEVVREVASFVLSFSDNVVGVHDLMIHDYGPGRLIITLHTEVPAEGDVLELHDMIDNIEKGLEEKFNCIATIHMDPVVTKSQRVTELKELCKKIVADIDPLFTMHDFRMNEGDTHANVIFDVVITHDTKLTVKEIQSQIDGALKNHDPKLNSVVTIEHSYV